MENDTSGQKDISKFQKKLMKLRDSRSEKALFRELNAIGYKVCRREQLVNIFDENDKSVIPIFIKYIDMFKDKRTKSFYISCLGVEGFYNATEYLLNEYEKMLATGNELLFDVSCAIAEIQDPAHIGRYLKLLRRENAVFETCFIIKMLGKMKVLEAIPCLIELLDGENETADGNMFVGKVVLYDSHEAEYIVTDGEYDLLCMDLILPFSSDPEEPKKGTKVAEIQAQSWNDMNIKRIDDDETKEYLVKKGKHYFSYHLQAKVVDKEAALVRIGDLIIEVDRLPEDLENGDFIGFDADRLDCVLDCQGY